MSRDEIDAAIKRHADVELLYDKPYEDKSVVRVTGPFTVESLSPHRSLAFAGGEDPAHAETVSEQVGATQPDAPSFEQSILENLQSAGVQNGRKSERIEFDTIEPYPGTFVQAVGVSTGSTTGRIALWMVDSDYNGDSFFVRHCYVTGGGEPFTRLQTALKAEIDADTWASLYGTTSRPFPRPSSGRIAVKVINDHGDEVMKIFDVAEGSSS